MIVGSITSLNVGISHDEWHEEENWKYNVALSKNIKNTAKILNENSYTNDDCMLILRTMLNKTKRLIKLRDDYDETKNLDSTVSNFRPLIFWKDKDIIKKQILKWDKKNSSELEKIIKKNSENSLRITYDFVLSTAN